MVNICYTDCMTGEILNLRRARKNKQRDAAATKAAENRAKHGRPLAERKHEAAESRRAEHAHSLLKLDKGKETP